MSAKNIKELLQPLKEGLLEGKIREYKRPEFEVRPLHTMLKELAKIELVDWYKYAFSREPLNGKFTDEQRREWAKKAIQCGEEYYEIICEKYASDDPVVLAKKMNMRVTYPVVPEKADRVLFAEYRMPDKICIYTDAVNKANRFLQEPEVSSVMTRKLDVKRLLLAHELFHYVEESYKSEIYTKNEKIRLWSIGPIHNDSMIIALSEIAAMAFAKKMAKIPYAPYLMDVLLVYGYSSMEASGLYEEMISYAK